MKRLCYFCKTGIKFTDTYIHDRKRFYAICYLCNKQGKHLRNDWSITYVKGSQYRFFEDKFIFKDNREISRLMLQLLPTTAS